LDEVNGLRFGVAYCPGVMLLRRI